MIRKIIEINEDKCDGCEECIISCPEGAIQMVNGKAKLVKDFYCDGLGACIGKCPQGAITVIEWEADAYDEKATIKNIIQQGEGAVQQHLEHLHEHKEFELLKEAEEVLAMHKGQKSSQDVAEEKPSACGCPGSQSMAFDQVPKMSTNDSNEVSALTHWPIQMHLIAPHAPHFKYTNLLLAADCVPFAMANFHQKFLDDKTLSIACPKLDQNQQVYLDKLVSLIDDSEIQSLSVMVMQVPCCSGLVNLAQTALQQSKRNIPVNVIIVGIRGEILGQQQIN